MNNQHRHILPTPTNGGRAPRVALFTPLPPARTGTADYAAALIPALSKFVDLHVLDRVPARFRPADYSLLIYEIANNPYHAPFYELALEVAGVVVLHEANLHHLIQGQTLSRGDELSYLREVIYEIYGMEPDQLRDRDLPIDAPQSHRFSMLRRVLSNSQACVVHSAFAEREVRIRGYRKPIRRIPHGASIGFMDGSRYRTLARASSRGPLIGMFGYHRPDKRAADCLSVFSDLRRTAPGAHLLIVGQGHPEVRLQEQVRQLGLESSVTILDFVDLVDFDGYLAACDIVLNLRSPTFGETSGTMMRAFGLGKAVVVSDCGAFRELPDDACVKIAPDEYQNTVLAECLRWMASDPSVPAAIGKSAQEWVQRECTWEKVAQLHFSFFQSLLNPHEGGRGSASVPSASSDPPAARRLTDANGIHSYLSHWVQADSTASEYLQQHRQRLARLIELTPNGTDEEIILEIGCYMQITPALRTLLGYGEVRGCYLGPRGERDVKNVFAGNGDTFTCVIDLFNVEVDPFPYPDEYFNTVICSEVLEHLERDPMHMMSEIHRVLRLGGTLILTTPNSVSLSAVSAVLNGRHPALYASYIRPGSDPAQSNRHAREYTPDEVLALLSDSGFLVQHLETGPYGDEDVSEDKWAAAVLAKHGLAAQLRGKCILASGRKSSQPRNRFPSWLYD